MTTSEQYLARSWGTISWAADVATRATTAARTYRLGTLTSETADAVASEVSADILALLAQGAPVPTSADIGRRCKRVADRMRRLAAKESPTDGLAITGLADGSRGGADTTMGERALPLTGPTSARATAAQRPRQGVPRRHDVFAVSESSRLDMRSAEDAYLGGMRSADLLASLDRPWSPTRLAESSAWLLMLGYAVERLTVLCGPYGGTAEEQESPVLAPTIGARPLTGAAMESPASSGAVVAMGIAHRAITLTVESAPTPVISHCPLLRMARRSELAAGRRQKRAAIGNVADMARNLAVAQDSENGADVATIRAALGAAEIALHVDDVPKTVSHRPQYVTIPVPAYCTIPAATTAPDVILAEYRPETLTGRRGEPVLNTAGKPIPLYHSRGVVRSWVPAAAPVELPFGPLEEWQRRDVPVPVAPYGKRYRPPAGVISTSHGWNLYRKVSPTALLPHGTPSKVSDALGRALKAYAVGVLADVSAKDSSRADMARRTWQTRHAISWRYRRGALLRNRIARDYPLTSELVKSGVISDPREVYRLPVPSVLVAAERDAMARARIALYRTRHVSARHRRHAVTMARQALTHVVIVRNAIYLASWEWESLMGDAAADLRNHSSEVRRAEGMARKASAVYWSKRNAQVCAIPRDHLAYAVGAGTEDGSVREWFPLYLSYRATARAISALFGYAPDPRESVTVHPSTAPYWSPWASVQVSHLLPTGAVTGNRWAMAVTGTAGIPLALASDMAPAS